MSKTLAYGMINCGSDCSQALLMNRDPISTRTKALEGARPGLEASEQ